VGFGKIICLVTPGFDSVLILRQNRMEGVCFKNIERGDSKTLPYLNRPHDSGPIQWARGDVAAAAKGALARTHTREHGSKYIYTYTKILTVISTH